MVPFAEQLIGPQRADGSFRPRNPPCQRRLCAGVFRTDLSAWYKPWYKTLQNRQNLTKTYARSRQRIFFEIKDFQHTLKVLEIGLRGLIIPRSSVRVAPPPPSVSRTCGPLQAVPPRRVNTELITKFLAAVWGTSAARGCCVPAHGCRTRVFRTARRRPCQFAVRRPHAVVAQVLYRCCGHDAFVAEQFLNPSHGQAGDCEPALPRRERDSVAPLRAYGVQPGCDKERFHRISNVAPEA